MRFIQLLILFFSIQITAQVNLDKNADSLSVNEQEINNSINWLNQVFNLHSQSKNNNKILYSFGKIQKTPLSGLLLCGTKETLNKENTATEYFYIIVDDILRFSFHEPNTFSIECSSKSNGIVLFDGKESYFKTYIYDIELFNVSDTFQTRILNCFKKIIENNIEYGEKNEKYYIDTKKD